VAGEDELVIVYEVSPRVTVSGALLGMMGMILRFLDGVDKGFDLLLQTLPRAWRRR